MCVWTDFGVPVTTGEASKFWSKRLVQPGAPILSVIQSAARPPFYPTQRDLSAIRRSQERSETLQKSLDPPETKYRWRIRHIVN